MIKLKKNEEHENNIKVSTSYGTGLATLLTVAFVVLKLVGVIDWAWIWVVSPIWISLGLTILITIVAVVIAVIIAKVGD